MKLIVKSTFRDKTDHVTVYQSGKIIDVKDEERAADLIGRGLCAEYKGRKAATATLEADTPETPETPHEAEGEGEGEGEESRNTEEDGE